MNKTIIMILIIVAVLITVAAIVCFFFHSKKGQGVLVNFREKLAILLKDLDIINNTVVLEGELSFMKDVVLYFQNLKLNPKEHTPFICDGVKAGDLFSVIIKQNEKYKNKKSLLLAVYSEKDDSIIHYKLLYADSFDQQTSDVLSKGEDGLVVLS